MLKSTGLGEIVVAELSEILSSLTEKKKKQKWEFLANKIIKIAHI